MNRLLVSIAILFQIALNINAQEVTPEVFTTHYGIMSTALNSDIPNPRLEQQVRVEVAKADDGSVQLTLRGYVLAGRHKMNPIELKNIKLVADGDGRWAITQPAAAVGEYWLKDNKTTAYLSIKISDKQHESYVSHDGSMELDFTIRFGEKIIRHIFKNKAAVSNGIETVVQTERKAAGVYDLNGRRVAQPKHGIYIVNGKKVML